MPAPTVEVEFLTLPQAVRILGSKQLTVAVAGRTVADLLAQLVDTHGPDLARLLLDEDGRLAAMYKLFLNDRDWLLPDEHDRELADGDRVTIMLLVGGG